MDKDAGAFAMADDGTNYFVLLGREAWHRPINNRIDWTKIETTSPVTGLGGKGAGNIKIACEDGVYALDGLVLGAKIDDAINAKIMNDGAIVESDPDNWGYTLVNGVSGYQGEVVGTLGAGKYVDSVGKNSTLYNKGLNITGADVDLLVSSESVGLNSDWDGTYSTFYSARYCISRETLGDNSVAGLVGTNETGYYEVHDIEGTSRKGLREPLTTINDPDAYLASDLSESLILGFYKGQGDEFFIFTMGEGLWSCSGGNLYWE